MADASAPVVDIPAGPASVAPDTAAAEAPPVKAPPPLPEWHFWPPAASVPLPVPSMNDELMQRLRPFSFTNAQGVPGGSALRATRVA
eukprot:11182253-Lingulodinium_polyedra.AAC.1